MIMAARTMTLSLADTLVPSDDVAFREIDREAVLLDLAHGTYFGLNAVGTRAWLLLVEGRSLGDVHAQLVAEYDVSPATLEGDLLTWASTLRDKGLICAKRP
jgi:hypothetical protein